jgi:hypothetical protein
MGTVAPVLAQEPLVSGAVTSEAEEEELEAIGWRRRACRAVNSPSTTLIQ